MAVSILKCPYCSDSIRKSGAYIVGIAYISGIFDGFFKAGLVPLRKEEGRNDLTQTRRDKLMQDNLNFGFKGMWFILTHNKNNYGFLWDRKNNRENFSCNIDSFRRALHCHFSFCHHRKHQPLCR